MNTVLASKILYNHDTQVESLLCHQTYRLKGFKKAKKESRIFLPACVIFKKLNGRGGDNFHQFHNLEGASASCLGLLGILNGIQRHHSLHTKFL